MAGTFVAIVSCVASGSCNVQIISVRTVVLVLLLPDSSLFGQTDGQTVGGLGDLLGIALRTTLNCVSFIICHRKWYKIKHSSSSCGHLYFSSFDCGGPDNIQSTWKEIAKRRRGVTKREARGCAVQNYNFHFRTLNSIQKVTTPFHSDSPQESFFMQTMKHSIILCKSSDFNGKSWAP